MRISAAPEAKPHAIDFERSARPRLGVFEKRPAGMRRFEAGLIIGWWTIYAVWVTVQYLAVYPGSITLPVSASRGTIAAVIWACITFITFALARRYRFDR